MLLGRNNQPILFDSELDRIAKFTLLDQGLGNADASRVSDPNNLDSHRFPL
jgi:hypothetical protein